MERTRRSNPVGLLAVLVIVATAGIVLLNLGNISVCTHALDRHGNDAVIATEWVNTHGTGGNRWDCNDGRQRWIVPYGSTAWAIVVMEAGEQITAFITDDQDYVVKQHDGCKQWQNWAHP